RSSTSWPWRARTSTRWKRSSWRFTPTRPCPKPWPRRRSIRSVAWWTCEGSPRDRSRRPGVRHRIRGRDYRGRARHRADAGAPREPFEHAGERRRSVPGGDARRPRRRRDLRLASQSLAGQPVAARRYRRPVGRGGAARGLPGLADRPSARHPGARRVGRRELRARGRGQCLVRAGKPGRRVEGWRVTQRRVQVIEAGRIPYGEALDWQRAVAQARIDGRLAEDLLLLLEHPPVVTLGRTARAAHLLHAEGVDVLEVERGGDVTFHGPGQLVGYPILDLRGYRQDLHWYLRTLEDALIAALAELGVPAERKTGYTGVWTGAGGGREIARSGGHVKPRVRWHGFAWSLTTGRAQLQRTGPWGIRGG